MGTSPKVAVIGGDGIGPEVVEQAIRVADKAAQKRGGKVEWNHLPWSSAYFKQHGHIVPPDRWETLKEHDAVFLGALQGEALAEVYASADVFVFTGRTDTFGLVLLEALASGLPVAAFPVAGPRDVIGGAPVGCLQEDLREACLAALSVPRKRCVEFAEQHSWEASARAFIDNMPRLAKAAVAPAPDRVPEPPRCAA